MAGFASYPYVLLAIKKRPPKGPLKLDYMAGVQGLEPQLTDPESAVLPLNDTPSLLERLTVHAQYNTSDVRSCQAILENFLGSPTGSPETKGQLPPAMIYLIAIATPLGLQ